MFLVTTCGRGGEELRTGDVWAEHFSFQGGVLKPETMKRVQNRMFLGIFVKIQFKACLETECVKTFVHQRFLHGFNCKGSLIQSQCQQRGS